MAKRDYLVEAAKQIRMALDSEVNEDYEAAFSYYKNGVDLLLNGVQREEKKPKTTCEMFPHTHSKLSEGL